MPSFSVSVSMVAVAGLAFAFEHKDSLTDIELKPLLYSLLSSSVTYSMWSSWMVWPRTPTFTADPIKTKASSAFGKFWFQHVADIIANGILEVATDTALSAPSQTGVIYMMRAPFVYTGNAQDIDYILNKNVSGFKKGRAYELFQHFFGEGLASIIDSDKHKKHRRIIGPAFSPKALKHLADVCVPRLTGKAVQALRSRVSKEAAEQEAAPAATTVVGDMHDWLDGLAFEIICQAAFKVEGGSEEITEVRRIFDDGMKAAFTPARMMPIVEKMTRGSSRRAAEERAKALKLISRSIKESGENAGNQSKIQGERADALIDYLVHSKELSDQQVADHSLIFLFAGFETTATALLWVLYELAKHPQVQEKILEEVSASFALGSCATMNDISSSCSYLTCVCKEILRLYTPAGMIARDTVEDEVLPGSKTFLPKGINITCVVNAIHRNPQYWGPDADEFKPERWEEPGFDQKVTGVCWIPFSLGKRNCIGKDFAMNELTLVLAQLVRNFEFSWPSGEPDPIPDAQMTTRPKQPYKIQVTNRTV